jgi:23S rRNA pseudouridine1911/1915/1917 synthase
LAGNDGLRPGIVHRLDRQTSGVMVLAKNEPAAACLADQFRRHAIDRVYLGIVDGVPSWSELRVDTLHGRDPAHRKRFSAAVSKGRRAVTVMEVQRPLRDAALVQFRLETGRTHQIRVHARHVGHPILHDELYGRRRPGMGGAPDRQALHAQSLGFEHPETREFVTFVSPLPLDLAALVANLAGPRLP